MAGALIVPDFEHLKQWCKQQNIPYSSNAKIIENKDVENLIKTEVQEVNKTLGKTEQIGPIQLIADEWTVAGGELSATLKVKRKIIAERYADQISQMFQQTI